MKIKLITAAALVTASALAFAGCAANEGGAATKTLTGKGASSQKAAQEKWVAAFQTANSGVTVNYAPDGSSAGRSAFVAGAVAFAGSDRPFKDEEMGAGKFAGCAADSNALNLPVYVSPIAVIYKLDGVDSLTLDPTAVASIFAGKITKWNDPAIAKLNPKAKLPDLAITAVHRADGSGTTNNFTDTLNQLAPTVWTEAASDDWPAAFSGEAANGTSGVVSAVSGGTGTIGYADASAAKNVGIADLLINGKTLKPEAAAAAAILDNSKVIPGRATNDLAYKLDRTAEGAYPAVLVSYAIVCQTYKDSATASLVKSYVGYIASAEGQQAAATAAGSAPLSADLQTKVKAAVDSIK
ncbi:MAG: phosphate ABC transporter substrate-binding protein PstS [Actinobacteria bacterium HGW-Actinobacteria-2]|nr:MAG: phosphate ABC transporter substrate-binding protein PstS [Actinobacteria bacterium HGW-Actinobacteria-2]